MFALLAFALRLLVGPQQREDDAQHVEDEPKDQLEAFRDHHEEQKALPVLPTTRHAYPGELIGFNLKFIKFSSFSIKKMINLYSLDAQQ